MELGIKEEKMFVVGDQCFFTYEDAEAFAIDKLRDLINAYLNGDVAPENVYDLAQMVADRGEYEILEDGTSRFTLDRNLTEMVYYTTPGLMQETEKLTIKQPLYSNLTLAIHLEGHKDEGAGIKGVTLEW